MTERKQITNDIAKHHMKEMFEELINILEDEDEKIAQIEDFFEKDFDSLVTVEKEFPKFKRNQLLYAFNEVLDQYKVDEPKAYFQGTETTPDYESIQIGRDREEPLLEHGYYFLKVNDTKTVFKINFDSDQPYVFIYMKERNNDFDDVKVILNDVDTFLEENNFLKNEVIYPDSNGVMQFLEYEAYSWENVILTDEQLTRFQRNLINPINNREEYKNLDIPWKRGILMVGPPGVGKTVSAKALAERLNCTTIWLTAKNLEDHTFMLDQIYNAARELAPTMVVLEDLDFFGKDRKLDGGSRLLGELLSQLDGISDNSGVFTVASTNHEDLLDEALANRPSRFDTKIRFDKPEYEQRKRLFLNFLTEEYEINQEELDTLVSQADGLTGAHIEETVIKARQLSLEQGDGGFIELRHLEDALDIIQQDNNGQVVNAYVG